MQTNAFVCICKNPVCCICHTATYAYGGAAQLEAGYLTVIFECFLNCDPYNHAPLTV